MKARGGQAMQPYETQLRVEDHARSLEREAANERLARAAYTRSGHAHVRRSRRGRSIRTAIGQALVRLGASMASMPRTDDPCNETPVRNAF